METSVVFFIWFYADSFDRFIFIAVYCVLFFNLNLFMYPQFNFTC